MAAPDFCTWDGDLTNVPRRPGTDDLGGDELEDDPQYPPTPNQHPTAAGWNQIVDQIVAMARVMPAARLWVQNSGTPAIASVFAPKSGLVAADFTVTDLGVGETKIEPAAGKLPAQTWKPDATIQGDNGGGTNTPGITIETIATGWIVHTFRNNVAVDVDFSLTVSGL